MKMSYNLCIISVIIIALFGGYATATTTCSSLTCMGSTQCCDQPNGAQCYDPSVYTCVSQMLCPNAYASACGAGCYNPSEYHCVNGQLQPGPAPATTAPTSAPTAAPTSAHTAAPTSAPAVTSAPTSAPTAAATTTTQATNAPTTATKAPTSAPTAAATTTTQAPTTTTTTTTTTKAPTAAPTTAIPVTLAPTLAGGVQQQTCSTLYCASGYCCQSTNSANGLSEYECYNPEEKVCTPMVMCTAGLLGCGQSCFNPLYFTCTNGQLLSI